MEEAASGSSGATVAVDRSAAPSPSPTTPSSASPAPSSTSPRAGLVRTRLHVQGLDVDVDEAARTVTWNKDQRVKQGAYSRYRFDYQEYVALVGKTALTEDVVLDAGCAPPTVVRGPSESPQQPIGGFVLSTYECAALRRP